MHKSQAGHVRPVFMQNKEGAQVHFGVGRVPYAVYFPLFELETVVTPIVRLLWLRSVFPSRHSLGRTTSKLFEEVL